MLRFEDLAFLHLVTMAEETECTLAMIKPDAVAAGKASEIQQLAEMHGFLIIAKRQLQV